MKKKIAKIVLMLLLIGVVTLPLSCSAWGSLTIAFVADSHIGASKAPYASEYYENLIWDLNWRTRPNYVFELGDMVAKNEPNSYEEWLSIRSTYWRQERMFSLPGNHERRLKDGYPLNYYEEITGFQNNYTVSIGNILIIVCGSKYHIISGVKWSDWTKAEFEWWKKLVINNQDKTIITLSHIAVKDTVFGSSEAGWHIPGSKEIKDVLENYQVDFWFSGHTHKSFDQPVQKYGTTFVTVPCVCGYCGYHCNDNPPFGVSEGWSAYYVLTFYWHYARLQYRINGYNGTLHHYFDDSYEYWFQV